MHHVQCALAAMRLVKPTPQRTTVSMIRTYVRPACGMLILHRVQRGRTKRWHVIARDVSKDG